MKLTTKTGLSFISSSAIFFLFGSVFMYYSVRVILAEDLSSRLYQMQNDFIENLNEYNDINLLKSKHVLIYKTDRNNISSFSDTVLIENDQYVLYRKIRFYHSFNNSNYKIEILQSQAQTRKYKINVLHLMDSAAPALMLAYGIGRIGCQMSGDGDWGIVNLAPKPDWLSFFPDWVWSYNFPNNVINAGVYIEGCTGKFCSVLPQAVWPTALYEVVMCIALFFVLWLIRRKIKLAGMLFAIYLIMNGIERFFIEKIRVNTEYNIFGGITQAEIISFCLIITGLILSYLLSKKVIK